MMPRSWCAAFEASLVTLSVLRRRIRLNDGKRKPPTPRGRRLSVDFRANLYAADVVLKRRKMIQSWLATPGLRRRGKKLEKYVNEDLEKARRAVGDDWIKRLQSGIILGLSVEVLSRNLGFATWYSAVYRPQSWKVHGADASEHLDWDEAFETITPNLGPDTKDATLPLFLANQLFMRVTDLINDRFQLGHSRAIRRIGQAIITPHGITKG